MIKDEEDGLWIDLNEAIAAPAEKVFHCVTTSHGLTMWLPVAAEVDLRPGGTVTLGWDAAMDRRTTIAILDYDAGGTITWDWVVGADLHAPLYWTVEPHVEEGAHVNLRQGPWAREPESMLLMAEEHANWRWQLCNLRAVLEVKFDMRRVRPL